MQIKAEESSEVFFTLPAVTELELSIVWACQERMSPFQNSLMVQRKKTNRNWTFFPWLSLAHAALGGKIDRNANSFLTVELWQEVLTQFAQGNISRLREAMRVFNVKGSLLLKTTWVISYCSAGTDPHLHPAAVGGNGPPFYLKPQGWLSVSWGQNEHTGAAGRMDTLYHC